MGAVRKEFPLAPCHRPKLMLFSYHNQGLRNTRSYTIKNTTVPVVPYDPSAQYYQRVEPTLDHTTSCFIDSLPPSVKELIRELRSKRVKPNLLKKYIPNFALVHLNLDSESISSSISSNSTSSISFVNSPSVRSKFANDARLKPLTRLLSYS